MKLKYIITSLIAILAIFTSCTEKYEAITLDEIHVSSSFVAIPAEGGSTSITVNAKDAWTITEVPEWLTVSATSGQAGETKVTFSAEATKSTNSCIVKLACGDKTQDINVLQMTEKVELPISTCKEVNTGSDGITYRIKGAVTKIANTTYGNMYISDGTDEVYIYGTLDATGAEKNFSSLGIEVGDIVTVEGPRTTYGSDIELKNVTVISIEKSLIKVDSITTTTLPSDGGEFSVFLENKGDGLYVDVPRDAQSWLSIKSIQGNKVTYYAAPNTAGPRSTTLTFSTVSDGKDYSAMAEITQEGLSGTADVPFTPEEAIAFCSSLSGQTAQNYYVKGIVSKIVGEFSEKYGNGSFWISNDGVFNDDLSKDFEAYQVYWFDGEKWVEGNGQVSVGDEVLICGPLTTYKGTAETAGKGAAHIVSINGISKAGYGLGSLAAPFTAEGAVIAANAGVSAKVYVAGKISKIAGDFSANYGNGSFFISDNGTYYGDQSKDFEAYQVYWLGGNKWVEANGQPAIGSDVVIYGPLTVYKGTAETQGKGAAYIYSIDGKTE